MKRTDIEEWWTGFKQRPWLTLGLATAASIVLVASSLLWKYLEEYAKRLSQRGELTIEQVVLGSAGAYSVVNVSLRNSCQVDVVIRTLALSAEILPKSSCCCPPTEIFQLEDSIDVRMLDKVSEISGSLQTHSYGSTKFKFAGRYVDDNCGQLNLQLALDASLTLKRDTISTVQLLVPQTLLVRSQHGNPRRPPVTSIKASLEQFDTVTVELQSARTPDRIRFLTEPRAPGMASARTLEHGAVGRISC